MTRRSEERSTQYTVGTQSGMQYTVRYAVRSRCLVQKLVNTHSELSKYGWWGPLPLVQKGQTQLQWGTQYAVGMQYAVRSTQYAVGMQ